MKQKSTRIKEKKETEFKKKVYRIKDYTKCKKGTKMEKE